MRDFTTWQRLVGQWGDTTFPSHYLPDGTPQMQGPASHLIEEAMEVAEAVEQGRDLADECADVVILALNLAHMAGFDLGAAVEKKMARNRARKWSEPNAQGVCHAVEEARA